MNDAVAKDATSKAMNQALEELARSGGLPENRKIRTSKLLDILPSEWSRDERVAAIKSLLVELLGQLSDQHRVAVEAALRLTNGRDISDTYAEKVTAWDRGTGLFARWVDLDNCMPINLRKSGPGAAHDKDGNEIPVSTTRKWWTAGRRQLARMLLDRSFWQDWLQKWQQSQEAIAPTRFSSATVAETPAPSESLQQSRSDETELELPPGYVRRAREEAEFHKLVAEGAKLIVFWGQPGMGKTSLAEALTGGAPFVFFDSQGEPHQDEVMTELRNRGIPLSEQPDSLSFFLNLPAVVGGR